MSERYHSTELIAARERHQAREHVKLAVKAAPAVRWIFEEAERQAISLVDLGKKSGVNKETMKLWRVRTVPSLANFEAVVNALGYELRIVKKEAEGS